MKAKVVVVVDVVLLLDFVLGVIVVGARVEEVVNVVVVAVLAVMCRGGRGGRGCQNCWSTFEYCSRIQLV